MTVPEGHALSNPLPARYAECIFWLARFIERAENLARILEVNETSARDRTGSQNWLSIIQINADEERFFEKHATATAESVSGFYVADAQNPTSIASAVSSARENARTLRPLVSTEMWVQLNVFHNRVRAIRPAEMAPGSLARLLTEIKEACQTFTGITEGTFYRDQAWYFYRIGRYIERADQTTRLLDAKYPLLTSGGHHAAPAEIGQWHAVLRSASGYHAFRRVHSSDLTPARVADFLLFNPAFPRSVYLCLREVEIALAELKSRYQLRGGNDISEGLDQLRSILAGRSIEEILATGLHEFIDFLQRYLIVITARLSATFFGYPGTGAEQPAEDGGWPLEPASEMPS
jgi:uncharacterized alpha-E superfamily protein